MIAVCSRRRIASRLVLLAALACVLPAAAATRRFAVIVANNRGAEGQPTLQFAEADAEKLALVLTELGGVAAADLSLLRGIAPSGVRGALGSVAEKVRQVHAAGADRAIVIFYYSGHSDGESLELGQDRLGFAELRTLLSSTGADIRVVLLDSCRSGALLALKGGQPAPAFQIRLSDEIASSGEALISSSASDEMALESREIKGSFFTHHLVSGLRGAADTSGDGRVTLAEAYEYVFKRTVTATAATTIGPQHPGYTYRLSGEGELVLTDLNVRTARLTIPTGLDRALIIDRRSERVLAEVGPGGASSLALPSGDYLVRATVGRSAMAATLHLRDGEQRTVSAAELSPAAVERATGKGFLQPEIAIWSLSVGASDGVADGMGMQLALRGSRQRGAFELAVHGVFPHPIGQRRRRPARRARSRCGRHLSVSPAGLRGVVHCRRGRDPGLLLGAYWRASRSDSLRPPPGRGAATGQRDRPASAPFRVHRTVDMALKEARFAQIGSAQGCKPRTSTEP